jgi:hypothetical protein
MRGNSHVQFLGGRPSERMGGYPTAASGLQPRGGSCIAGRHKRFADPHFDPFALGLMAISSRNHGQTRLFPAHFR